MGASSTVGFVFDTLPGTQPVSTYLCAHAFHPCRSHAQDGKVRDRRVMARPRKEIRRLGHWNIYTGQHQPTNQPTSQPASKPASQSSWYAQRQDKCGLTPPVRSRRRGDLEISEHTPNAGEER